MADDTTVVDERLLPVLRVKALGDVLCFACGVFVGRINWYRSDKIGLASCCAVCLDNREYAARE